MRNRYRTIILHVGLHKTGSTSIQNNCQFRHHELLLACGIMYPSFRFEGKLFANHGGPVTAALFDEADRYGIEWRAGLGERATAAQSAFRATLIQLLEQPQADTLVLSGEIFSLYSEQDLALLRDLLTRHCDHFRVLLYLRNPLAHIESVVQQRVRAGRIPDPAAHIGIMSARYQRLQAATAPYLEVQNFDACLTSPLGLVGSFLETCGIAREKLAGLTYREVNKRVSLEAFRLMQGINLRVPRKAYYRARGDLKSLYHLPGTRFGLYEFRHSPDYSKALTEKRFFEQHLGFHFPELHSEEPVETWGFDTLAVLEQEILGLRNPRLRKAAASFLLEEADQLDQANAETGKALRSVSTRLSQAESSSGFTAPTDDATVDGLKLRVPHALRRGGKKSDERAAVHSARSLIELVSEQCGLDDLSGIKMLDMGCGVRLVQAMLEYDLPIGQYTGIDVGREAIDFLKKEVTDTRFAFHHVDFHNPMYNPAGKPLSATDRLPAPEAHFDVICLFSVFTHLAPGDYSAMLQLLRRYIKPDGMLIFSLFIRETTRGGLGLIDGLNRALQVSTGKLSSAEWAEATGDAPDFEDVDPANPLKWAVYSRKYAIELVESIGWVVDSLNEPLETIQHFFVCRPAEPGSTSTSRSPPGKCS